MMAPIDSKSLGLFAGTYVDNEPWDALFATSGEGDETQEAEHAFNCFVKDYR